MPSFFVEWFSLLYGGIKLCGEQVLGGLKFFVGFDSMFCQKPVLRQIFLELYRVLQQIPTDLSRTASFGCTAQQINIVEIQRTEAVNFGEFPETALTDIMPWNR